jgi:hypothetical protein
MQVGALSGVMSVTLEGNDGNPVVAPAGGIQLNLSSSSPTGTFYDSTGTSQVTSVTVPSGSSSASFQYADASSGTPTITVTPPGGSGLQAAAQQATITAPPLVIKTQSVKDATVGVAYHVQFLGIGGVKPYAWSLSGGSLPSGLKLSKHGVLSGTPTESGQFRFDVSLQDAQATTVGESLTLTVDPIAADGSGTLTVKPRSALLGSAGNTLTFRYKAPTTGALAGGTLQIVVPAGWSPPSTLATDPGDVTANGGAVSVSGMTITVTGVTLAPGASLKIVYGGTGGGGPGATAPSTAGASHFHASEQSTSSGTVTALAKSPAVKVS